MKLNDIQPFVRQAVISKLRSGLYSGQKIKTRDCRLFYILHGSGEIIIENTSYSIKAGTVILFQSGTQYIWQITDMRYIAINFDYTMQNRHIRRTFSPVKAEAFPAQNFSRRLVFSDAEALNSEIVFFDGAAFESRITELAVECNTAGIFRDEFLSSLLKSIIISIVRGKSEQELTGDNKGARLTRRVIGYLQANYNKPIQSPDLAAHFHFNPSYLNRVFKAHTGFTIRTFLIDYRINLAMELLRSQSLTVSEVATAVGFGDIPHFIKTFKKLVGQTPTEYRALFV